MKFTRKYDARPDVADFRDYVYRPSLTPVPPTLGPHTHWLNHQVPVLDQGREGACTGYALATVIHYLLRKFESIEPKRVSPHMLYEMAKRNDEWRGEDYEGSSARGAMKGFHKHGVCSEALWPSDAEHNLLTYARVRDASEVRLGAYYRVRTRLVDMHAALADVGALLATASVHSGWDEAYSDGLIPYRQGSTGAHAFAIVGYDAAGFWFQNSWGSDWGMGGLGRLSYRDWLSNGADAWVCRLGVPVIM